MKMADVRRLAIRQNLKVHFRLRNGLECVVGEDGIARIPDLKTIPDFNLEVELADAGEFLVEPALPGRPRNLARPEMITLAAGAPAAAAAHDHDDD